MRIEATAYKTMRDTIEDRDPLSSPEIWAASLSRHTSGTHLE